MKKNIFVKCISVVLAVCLCINFWNGDCPVYAGEANDLYDFSDAEFVAVYNEVEPGISANSFTCERRMYLDILNPIDDSVGANIEIILEFEYSDSSWVVVNDANLNVKCYNGFGIIVTKQKVFGGWDTSYDYCRRTFILQGTNGKSALYYLYAGADCYGDTYMSCELQKIYD